MMGVIVRLTDPERGFVELNASFPDSTKNLGAQAPIADGCGFHPLCGRPSKPQCQLRFGCPGLLEGFNCAIKRPCRSG